MKCDRCGREAILFQRYSGLHLCRDHFEGDLAARAMRTLRARGGIRPGDRIAVALSGGPASSSLLHLLSTRLGMRRDLSLVAVTVDEGPGSGRDMTRIGGIARGMGIGWEVAPIARESEGLPCSPCTLFRDRALASLAKSAGATRLAVGTNLEDVARSVLLHVLRGEASLLDGPDSGGSGIPRILPLIRIPGEELSLYARLNVPGHIGARHPAARTPLEKEAGRILKEYTNRHPSAMFSLANLAVALQGRGAGSRSPSSECGKPEHPGCPAREIHGGVTGHG